MLFLNACKKVQKNVYWLELTSDGAERQCMRFSKNSKRPPETRVKGLELIKWYLERANKDRNIGKSGRAINGPNFFNY